VPSLGPGEIAEYILLRYGFALSSHDICRIAAILREPDQELYKSDTEELEFEVHRAGGRTSVMCGTKKTAVFAITPAELENWRWRFGDVISIDGVQVPNRLRCMTIPVTPLNQERSLACGGVFHRVGDEGVLSLVLFALAEEVPISIENIFMDEDQAVLAAEALGLNFLLCSGHKPIRSCSGSARAA
jgi:hypothetical protein